MSEKNGTSRSSLDELLEQFESLSAEEQRHEIAEADEYLRANGVKSLDDFDKLMRTK